MLRKLSQTESGKAWEYGLAKKIAQVCSVPLGREGIFAKSFDKAKGSYELLRFSQQKSIDDAAGAVIDFLQKHEPRFENAASVSIQPDKAGQVGDVRDIVIECKGKDSKNKNVIGISAKHHHKAVKHSRLSDKIDFGDKWYNKPCSATYFEKINPIFEGLKKQKEVGKKWAEIPNKFDDIYLPVLEAFVDEVEKHGDAEGIVKYLLGKYDYYKVVKENGTVFLQSFNINGTLGWGGKIAMPKRIIDFTIEARFGVRSEVGSERGTSKPNSKTTAILCLDKGWQISFRIHNASSRVEPSLKFDVQLVGIPDSLVGHYIIYDSLVPTTKTN